VAEGGGLLNRYTLQRRIEGSNPSVSAKGVPESLSESGDGVRLWKVTVARAIPIACAPIAGLTTKRCTIFGRFHSC
jgi:hypothetical protein